MSDLERAAVQRVIDRAAQVGVPVPRVILDILDRLGDHGPGYAARTWAAEHPDDAGSGCCDGDAVYGPERCTCWRPVFDVEQAPPRPIRDRTDLTVRPGGMCGDCAYRPGSPERAEEFLDDALRALPAEGKPFYCHAGIRLPVRWEHPDGRTVPGDPSDYQPLMVQGVPYQADGSPAMLCAGWSAIAAARRATTAPAPATGPPAPAPTR